MSTTRFWRISRSAAILAIAGAIGGSSIMSRQAVAARAGEAPVSGYRVVNAFPHDPNAYTQGLIYRDGFLFESTGLNGRSSLRKIELKTGKIVQQRSVDRVYFAEGLTDWKDRLIQLTWQSNVAFVYELSTFAPERTFSYAGEGWGLTHDAKLLIMSDGSEYLRFLDPETFRETRRLAVHDGTVAVRDLNELEYIRGEIYANVWHTDRIARISPSSGQVTSWIDVHGLMAPYRLDSEAVLNGIAYDASGNRLFVTGKLWPKLFEIAVAQGRR